MHPYKTTYKFLFCIFDSGSFRLQLAQINK
jgi:hypothetical protein